jgi:hypothetical protein
MMKVHWWLFTDDWHYSWREERMTRYNDDMYFSAVVERELFGLTIWHC